MPDGSIRRIDAAVKDRDEWIAEGLTLGARERSARSLMWDVGDWWNRGEAYGERAQIVTAGDWIGPKHGTCREAGRVAGKFDPSMRIDTLTFYHHQIVAALPVKQAISLLRWAAEGQELRSTQELQTRVKQVKRAAKVAKLADATEEASRQIGTQLYAVIYADPPWRFTPYSDEGLDRAADNHYETMTTNDILALADKIPAAKDCVLFLWATVPMLVDALEVMLAWGFTYKSNFVWVKDKAGTGFWNRNKHELLLVGTRGDVPAPAPGEQLDSVIPAKARRHSEKPPAFAELIEEMYPNAPAIELFARKSRLGWHVWGNETVAS
jgi:N6-adenosine-specific RNA methylase IME4